MRYNVNSTYYIGENTIASISGDGTGIKNGSLINEGKYKVLSVAMSNAGNILERTTMVIEGHFNEKEIVV